MKIKVCFSEAPTDHYMPRLLKGDLTPERGPNPVVYDNGEIVGLPEPDVDVICLVNARVFAVAKELGRDDIRCLPRGFPQDDSAIYSHQLMQP